MRRVGWFGGAAQPQDVFEHRGREQWELVRALAGAPPDLTGYRILDFGCGAGRMLRPAVAEHPGAEWWGCDTDAPSVRWLRRELGGRARVLHTRAQPPLPAPAEHFQLIYAFSVFTHLIDSWSAWLLELHRVLTPGGTIVATVVGPGRSRSLHGEIVSEDVIGMNVLSPARSWDQGGPLALHSEWWLRAHWGRAFEIVQLRPGDQAGSAPQYGQALVVMRKRPGTFSTGELERPEPDEPRELAALRQNVASLRREITRNHGAAVRRFRAPAGTIARRLRARARPRN